MPTCTKLVPRVRCPAWSQVHYVPVDHLFTSLPAVVHWARGHDDAVRRISRNADKYADAVLSARSRDAGLLARPLHDLG